MSASESKGAAASEKKAHKDEAIDNKSPVAPPPPPCRRCAAFDTKVTAFQESLSRVFTPWWM